MPKLTDDEVGQLLRETFADKENLVDQLPEATTSPVRRKLPVLIAAASVLAVLGGAVSIVGTDHKQEARPTQTPTVPLGDSYAPAASKPTAAVTTTLELNLTVTGWGLVLKEALKLERPAGGWPAVKILDRPYRGAGDPSGPGVAGIPFDAKTRTKLAGYADAQVEWVKSRPTGANICDQPAATPYITLGPVVFDKKAESATVGVSVWRSCQDGMWATYRLADVPNPKGGADWKITGTVGPVARS
ncbi:hypothetical protein [Kribbella catacumbae]|uniref:hypothetical protein n=1 Tax=Kribbella catacumbae TaxID=460086 RepID=UPI0003718D28|nr:hypothetical protein [Kribbella catacumbae]